MRLSNSKANTYRRCPKRFEYKYEQKLRPKRRSAPLERGSWLHTLLEVHYENDPRKKIEVPRKPGAAGKKKMIQVGTDWRRAQKVLANSFYTLFDVEQEDLGDLPGETERIMRSYLRRWQKEDQRYRMIDTELNEILTMPNGVEFNFIIDLIVEDDDGGLWLWDHKTVKSFMDADFMLLDSQLSRYFWAAETMGYKPLRGVVFNEIRTKPPAVPEILKSGGLSQRQNMDTDYFTYLREIKRHGLDPANYDEFLHRLRQNTAKFFRRTTMPRDTALTKRSIRDLLQTGEEIEAAQTEGRFPRAVNKTCSWDCDYKDLCITDLFGGDASSLINANFEISKRD